ncbi:MAG: hypothetical protein WCF90_07570 [Methanomicrobiales archaeon]
MDDVWVVTMLPLRPYEMAAFPPTALEIEPEPDTFAIPGEQMNRDELGFEAQPIVLPPLRWNEFPDSAVFVLDAVPNSALDEPSWGMGAKAPDIMIRNDKLLHLWEEGPIEKKKQRWDPASPEQP